MKKILMIILMLAIVSPTFAYADDDKSSRKGDNDSRKSAQMIQKKEKKETKKEIKEARKELENKIKSHKKDNDDNDEEDDKRERYYATTTPVIIATSIATTSTPVKNSQKINYFLCKTDTGWDVVSLAGEKNKNSARALGKYCMKLPYGFAKKFNETTATATPDVLAPVISGIVSSAIASTTATVSWNTNELATGKIWYGTSTPLTLYMQNTTPSLAHSFNLIGLNASTTYSLLIESTDNANNTATSTTSLVTTN